MKDNNECPFHATAGSVIFRLKDPKHKSRTVIDDYRSDKQRVGVIVSVGKPDGIVEIDEHIKEGVEFLMPTTIGQVENYWNGIAYYACHASEIRIIFKDENTK